MQVHALTTTSNVVLVGRNAGGAINSTDANGTIAIGYEAGKAITSGQQNTLVGFRAGENLADNDYNTAVGYQTLEDCTGNYNTAIGTEALHQTATANINTAIGFRAGYTNTTGYNNTFLGVETYGSANNAINQIVIGKSAVGQGNNYAVIGNADITRVYAAQDGAGVLYANGTIQSSDRRLKENIEDSDLGLEFINKIRPVSYKYINDKQDGKTKYGIIAQEVQEVLKESNNEDFAGIKDSDEYLGADYNQFVAPLIKSVQELSSENKELKDELNELKILIKKKLGDE